MISIKVDDEEILNLSDGIIKILEYILKKDDIKNRLSVLINGAIALEILQAKNSLQDDWVPKIRERFDSMPTKDNNIAALIFSQPDYQDKDQQDSGGKI